jgi:hypothetical protein
MVEAILSLAEIDRWIECGLAQEAFEKAYPEWGFPPPMVT